MIFRQISPAKFPHQVEATTKIELLCSVVRKCSYTDARNALTTCPPCYKTNNFLAYPEATLARGYGQRNYLYRFQVSIKTYKAHDRVITYSYEETPMSDETSYLSDVVPVTVRMTRNA